MTKTEACNFADYNTIYSCVSNLKKIFTNLKEDLKNGTRLTRYKQIQVNSNSWCQGKLPLNGTDFQFSKIVKPLQV